MQNQENIDKYLNRQMSATEQSAFEQQMADDVELKKSVSFQRDLMQFFATRAPRLEAQLEQFGNQYFLKKTPARLPYFWWGMTGVLLILLLFYFLPKEQNSIPVAPVTESVDTLKTADTLVTKTTTKTDSVEGEEIKPQTPKPVKKEKPVIAQLDPADFQTNPFLEDLMQRNLRNDGIEIKISKPNPNEALPFAKEVVLQLMGTTNAAPPYRIKLFSNKIADFENDQQLLNMEFASTAPEADFAFNFQTELALPRGLYYYLIEQVEGGELLLVSKFEVR